MALELRDDPLAQPRRVVGADLAVARVDEQPCARGVSGHAHDTVRPPAIG